MSIDLVLVQRTGAKNKFYTARKFRCCDFKLLSVVVVVLLICFYRLTLLQSIVRENVQV